MYKGNRQFEFVGSNPSTRQRIRDALSSPFIASIEALSFLDRGHPECAGQPLFADDPKKLQTYQRVKLKDGTTHWVVSAIDAVDVAVLVVIAADHMTGIWYTLACPLDQVAWVQVLPPELVEMLPEEERPFGFADHPAVRSTSGKPE